MTSEPNDVPADDPEPSEHISADTGFEIVTPGTDAADEPVSEPEAPDVDTGEGSGVIEPVGENRLAPSRHYLDKTTVISTMVWALETAGIATRVESTRAIDKGHNAGLSPARSLVHGGVCSLEQLQAAYLQASGVRTVNVSTAMVPDGVFDHVDFGTCLQYRCLPISFDPENGFVEVAVVDPDDLTAVNVIAEDSGLTVTHVAGVNIDMTLDSIRQRREAYGEIGDTISSSDDDDDEDDEQGVYEKLVNSIITDAQTLNAVDIHLEPMPDTYALQYRIDGVIETIREYPHRIGARIVRRIKSMAQMGVVEGQPQDGSCTTNFGKNGTRLDLRVAISPTAWEQDKCVVRLLMNDPKLLDLDFIFAPDDAERWLDAIDKPTGLHLVVGKTGDGKSTTVAATNARLLESPRFPKIITIENPVEIRIPGLSQLPVTAREGLAFHEILTSVLRQDPDMVNIGEIRDIESAKVGLMAAQTGHGVFATLHIRDTASAASRLVGLGVDPVTVADTLETVLAQRLVRRLCSCKIVRRTDPGWVATDWAPYTDMPPPDRYAVPNPNGCDRCRRKGYSGRYCVPEILVVTPAVEALMAESATASEIRAQAIADGMIPMMDNALKGVAALETDVAEILNHVDYDQRYVTDPNEFSFGARTLRTVCRTCADTYLVDEEWAKNEWGAVTDRAAPKFRSEPAGVGCSDCDGTGFAGNVRVQEVVILDDASAVLVHDGADLTKIREEHLESGKLVSLFDQALDLVTAGLIPLSEATEAINIALEGPFVPGRR